MVFLRAFFFGGLFCVIFQAIRVYLGDISPAKLNVLGFALGGLFFSIGFSQRLEAAAYWGYDVTVVSGGSAGASSILAFLSGAPAPLLHTLLLFLSTALIGIAAGLLRCRSDKK